MTIKELREKRAALVADMRALLDTADGEKRAMSDEEQQSYDKMQTDLDAMTVDLARREKLEAEEGALAQRSAEAEAARVAAEAAGRQEQGHGRMDVSDVMRRWGLCASGNQTAEDEQILRAAGISPSSNEFSLTLRHDMSAMRQELRADMSTSDGYGGETIPEGFFPRFELAMLAFGGVRGPCTVIRTATGNPLPMPTSNDTGNVGRRIAENTQNTNKTGLTTSSLTLNAYTYTSDFIPVSNELMQDSAFDLASVIGAAAGERIGRIQATEFTTGTGSAQPNGIVTAATLGKTAASAYAITVDELKDLLHSVDPAYRMGAGWMMQDGIVKVISKLKDDNGNYLWQPSIVAGTPDRLLNYPVHVNQAMASSLLGSAKTVLFGDLKKYYVRDCTGITVRRLVERFADYNQTAFIAFLRSDADLLDAGTHPIKYLQQAQAGGGTGSGTGA